MKLARTPDFGVSPVHLGAALPSETVEQRIGVSALALDVGSLASIMARLTGRPYVRVRLERVNHNACRYFHVDRVAYRLVCTYRGPGT